MTEGGALRRGDQEPDHIDEGPAPAASEPDPLPLGVPDALGEGPVSTATGSAVEPPLPLARVRPPRQSRSVETFECFLTAAYELLLEQPPQALTVSDIVERASRPNGSFYARFSDKWAAVDAVLEQVVEKRVALAHRYLGTVGDASVRELVEAYVAFVEASYRSEVLPSRAVVLRTARSPEMFRLHQEMWAETAAQWADKVVQRGVAHPRPHRAAATACALVQSVVAWEHLYGTFSGGRPVPSATLVQLALSVLGEPATAESGTIRDVVPMSDLPPGPDQGVRAPRQTRGVEALGDFVGALEALLDERDYDEITVSDIARGAHRSPGSFYARFASRNDCLLELLRSRLQRAEHVGLSSASSQTLLALQALPVSQAVLTGISVSVARAHEAAPLHRVLSRQAVVDPAAQRIFRSQRLELCASFRSLLLHRDNPPVRQLPGLLYLAVTSLLDQLVFYDGDPFHPYWDRTSMARDLGDAGLRILGADPVVADGDRSTLPEVP
jgi:AcrR family transcriptional regulator